MAHLTWVQTAGGTVRTVRSTRGNTGTRAGPNGAIGRITYRLDPRIGPLHRERNRVARGGTQGGLNCLTHALPRCLPTPTEEADGNGYSVIAGRGGPSRPPPRASVNLVPLLWTGVRLDHPPGRTDKNLCRCFGAPARRVFPDHLITCLRSSVVRWRRPRRLTRPAGELIFASRQLGGHHAAAAALCPHHRRAGPAATPNDLVRRRLPGVAGLLGA